MWRIAGTTGAVGIEVAVAIVIGYVGGHWLDGKLRTAPWLSLIGFASTPHHRKDDARPRGGVRGGCRAAVGTARHAAAGAGAALSAAKFWVLRRPTGAAVM